MVCGCLSILFCKILQRKECCPCGGSFHMVLLVLPLTVVKFLTWQPTRGSNRIQRGMALFLSHFAVEFFVFCLASMTVTSLALWRPALSSRSCVPFSSLSCIVLGRAHAVTRGYTHERETVKGPELGSNQVFPKSNFPQLFHRVCLCCLWQDKSRLSSNWPCSQG